MNKATSIYLDLIRLLAAVIVMFYHFAYERFSGGGLQFIRDSHIGSDAVILFFVLSGYVIAYVTAERDRNVHDYTINRLARLWSVVLPALLLTIIVDQLGILINPEVYDGWWYQDDSPLIRLVANVFFLNELWFHSIRPFTNGPFWSLGYEFWYYVIFGAAFYFKGRLRFALIAFALLIAGPKILLLFPVWLIGAWAWRFSKTQSLSQLNGWLLFITPLIIYILIKSIALDQQLLQLTETVLNTEKAFSVLGFSDEFMISYVYGVLIAMNFIGMNIISAHLERVLTWFEKPIRYWAGLTFSLYLLHYPLFQFFSAVFPVELGAVVRSCLILISTLIVIVFVGNMTEKKKYFTRGWVAALINRLFVKT